MLRTIAALTDRHCYLPTIAELARELSISRSTAFGHIAELRRKSLLCESPGKARSLKLTHKARKLLRQIVDTDTPEVSGVPLLGKVAAGLPVDTAEIPETISLGDCFGNGDDVFALEVTGSSMIDKDIRDGDYVICKRAATANNGQIVIALTDNQNTTLKRFYKEDSRIRLQPANKDFDPIYSNNCQIQAVAIGLVRKL